MATSWNIGDRIQNRWEIYHILRGGMGSVYIVLDCCVLPFLVSM